MLGRDVTDLARGKRWVTATVAPKPTPPGLVQPLKVKPTPKPLPSPISVKSAAPPPDAGINIRPDAAPPPPPDAGINIGRTASPIVALSRLKRWSVIPCREAPRSCVLQR